MRETRIGKRYAKALFDLSLERNELEAVNQDINLVYHVISTNKDFRLMLKSPIINAGKKEAIIRDIFGKHITTLSLQFLLLITRKKRESYIQSIAQEFIDYYKAYKNIITTYLETAVPIDKNISQQVIALLEQHTKGQVELIEEVKQELIGGFIMKYKDRLYDASISKQISDLKKEFNINLYERKI